MKRRNVQEKYPEIITDLVEKAKHGELIHFSLSSFFSEKPLEVALKEMDKTMTFFSVYIAMEPLEERLWEDSRNRFVFDRLEKGLWLNFSDLVGNFRIAHEEGRRILRNVKRI